MQLLCYQDQIIQKAKKIYKRFSPRKPQTPNQKRNYCKYIFLTNKQCQFNKLSRKLKTFARSGCIPCRPKILMTSFSKSLFLLLSEQIVPKLLSDKKLLKTYFIVQLNLASNGVWAKKKHFRSICYYFSAEKRRKNGWLDRERMRIKNALINRKGWSHLPNNGLKQTACGHLQKSQFGNRI